MRVSESIKPSLTGFLIVFIPVVLMLCTVLFYRSGILTVEEVAKDLACLCDTCPRRPLHECTCSWADQNRERIARALQAGQDKQTIVSGFIRDFGQEVLSAPPKEGYYLVAWVMPFLMIGAGGLMIRKTIFKWSRDRLNRETSAPQAVPQTKPDAAYLARLEQELKEFDSPS